jgi:hypothetical protein
MNEENQNQNQNETPKADELAQEEIIQPAEEKISSIKFEMPSFFAMLITLGLYTCSAMLIMALAQI